MQPVQALFGTLVLGIGVTLYQLPAVADIAAAEAMIAARNYDAAIAELSPMAEAGDSYAAWKLAELYLAGHGGSVAEGIALLQRSAAAGEPEAQARLGVLHARGDGVARDDVAAYQWLSLAVRGFGPGRSLTLAETNMTVVAGRLTPEQRAAALATADQITTGYQPAPISAAEEIATTAMEPLQQTPEAVPAPATVPSAAPASDPALAASYRVQLASVRNPGDVEGESMRLRKRIGAPLDGLRLHVQEVDLGAQGIYHRLQFGPFATKQDAAASCARIKAGGADCLVVAP
jgi:hypothetical protein